MHIFVYVEPESALQLGLKNTGLSPVYLDPQDVHVALTQASQTRSEVEAVRRYLAALIRWQDLFLVDRGLADLTSYVALERVPQHLLGCPWLVVRSEPGAELVDYTLRSYQCTPEKLRERVRGEAFAEILPQRDEVRELSARAVVELVITRLRHVTALNQLALDTKLRQQQQREIEGELLLVQVWNRLVETGPSALVATVKRESDGKYIRVVLPPAGYNPREEAHRKLMAQALDLCAEQEQQPPTPITDPMPGPTADADADTDVASEAQS